MLPNLSKTRAHITGIKINTRTIGHTKLRTTPLCHTGIKNNTHAILGGVHNDTNYRVCHTGIKNNTRTT